MNQNMTFYKDANGKTWYFGFYSNNFRDRDDEFLSWAAHLEYRQWLKDSRVVPQITFFHQPRLPALLWHLAFGLFEKGRITTDQFNNFISEVYKDYSIAETRAVIPVDGFMLVIGEVYPDKVPTVEKMLATDITWGMSHGFISLEDDDNIIKKYRSFEFSVLPVLRAANTVTSGAFSGVDMMQKGMSPEDQALLDEIFGEGTATKTEEAVQRATAILRGILDQKSIGELLNVEEVEKDMAPVEALAAETPVVDVPAEVIPVVETPVVEEVESPAPALSYEQIREQIIADLGIAQLQEALRSLAEMVQSLVTTQQQQGQNMETIKSAVEDLGTKMKTLEQTEDEKVAAQFVPMQWNMYAPVAPAKQQEKVEDQEALIARLKEQAPSSQEPNNNPLYAGLYKFLG
jgi:hypothetical protein